MSVPARQSVQVALANKTFIGKSAIRKALREAIRIGILRAMKKTINFMIEIVPDSLGKNRKSEDLRDSAIQFLRQNVQSQTGRSFLKRKWTLKIAWPASYSLHVDKMPASNRFSRPGTGPNFIRKVDNFYNQQVRIEINAEIAKLNGRSNVRVS